MEDGGVFDGKEEKKKRSSSLGETCKIDKNEEEEEIKMESSNGELKKKKNKKKKGIDCKETSSPDQETFNTAKKELLDDATEMESGSGERKKTKKVIEGVEVDGKTEITGDKEYLCWTDYKPAEFVYLLYLCYNHINQLGEEGLEMVLNSRKYPQMRGCWKEICASIPWRPYLAVYGRARTILQMSGKRGFSEEERDIIRKFRAKHGPKWAKLAKILGKPRMHIKDAWRRFRLPNVKLGKWSQDEYQALFDLVNLDLRIKSFEERKNLNVMFRENIAWEAISEKISTRSMSSCCHKWYDQLTSPLVRQGEWVDTDDYRLIVALQKQDACDVEDVDWDHLLENRSGEICRKRWDEMVRYIGGNREKSFIEQVDVLSKRYCIDILPYRESKEETVEGKEED